MFTIPWTTINPILHTPTVKHTTMVTISQVNDYTSTAINRRIFVHGLHLPQFRTLPPPSFFPVRASIYLLTIPESTILSIYPKLHQILPIMASYLQSPILNLHVANVKPGVTQRDFGHVWLGLIHYYFKLDDNLAGEEHVYETPEEHSNVLAVSSKDGKWRTHLSVLAKNFPDASQPANGTLAVSSSRRSWMLARPMLLRRRCPGPLPSETWCGSMSSASMRGSCCLSMVTASSTCATTVRTFMRSLSGVIRGALEGNDV